MSGPQTPTTTIVQSTRQEALATLMAPYTIPTPETARTREDDAS